MMNESIQRYEDPGPMSVIKMKEQVNLIQHMLKEVMKPDVHYGKIPGCGDKPTLLKAGAEKIALTFRLAPSYEIKETNLDKGNREYRVVCTLTHIPSGQVFGQGVGVCSTMEGKYRYRTGEVTLTDKPVPREYWDDRDIKLIGGKGHSTKKDPDTGKWMIAIAGKKVEHDNPADHYNTVLKMGKKRAQVDATLTATAASDCFTQDIEDMPEVIPGAKNFQAKPAGDVVDVTPEDPPDDSEADWEREQGKVEEQGEIPYSERPAPKGIKIDNQHAKVLFAKLKAVSKANGWSLEDEKEFMADQGFKSTYEVTEEKYEDVKALLDRAIKK